MTTSKQKPSFMELVELHERKWGTTQYTGRPSLQELLTAPIVALWTYQKRFILSVHATPQELNDLVDKLFRSNEPSFFRDWSLAKIFVNHHPIDFRVGVMAVTTPDSVKKTAKHEQLQQSIKETPPNPKMVILRRIVHEESVPSLGQKQIYLKYGDQVPSDRPYLDGRKAGIHRYRKSPRSPDEKSVNNRNTP